MSQKTPPHQASIYTNSSENRGYPTYGNTPPYPPQEQHPVSASQHSRPARSTEDFFLNIVLYIGSLLLIGAAALFITSVTSSKDETAFFRVLALGLGAIIFYSAGLLTYQLVKRLRLASYSFTATGLAFIPLTGVAAYVLDVWDNGGAIWLTTSLVGTAAIIGACTLMRNRVMGYLLASFLVSDSLAATKITALPFVWYFIVLTLVATVLGLLLHFYPRIAPRGIREGLVDSSRVFVPVTAIAIIFCLHDLMLEDIGIAFAVMSVHAFIFTSLEGKMNHYLQARIYPLISLLAFAEAMNIAFWTPAFFTLSIMAVNFAAVYLFIPRMQRLAAAQKPTPLPAVPQSDWKELPTTIAQIKLTWLPTFDAYLGLGLLFCAFMGGLFSYRNVTSTGRWDAFLPYSLSGQSLFPAHWVMGIFCLVGVLLYRKTLQPLALIIASAVLPLLLLLSELSSHNAPGSFYVFFAVAAITSILTAKDTELRFTGVIISRAGYTIGAVLLLHALFPESGATELAMVFSIICAATALSIFVISSKSSTRSLDSQQITEMTVYLLMGTLSLLAMVSINIGQREALSHLWARYGLFSAAILLLSFLSMVLLTGAYKLATFNIARTVLIVQTRIVLYTLLYICILGSYRYSTIGNSQEPLVALLPALLTILYAIFGSMQAHGSVTRFELLSIARFPICWSLILLAITGDIERHVLSFLLILLLAAQTLCSIILYSHSQRISEMYTAAIIFGGAVLWTVCFGMFDVQNLLTTVGSSALLLMVWAVGLVLKVPCLQISASVNFVFFCNVSAWHIFAPARTSETVLVYGYASLLAVLVLYFLKAYLPVEVVSTATNIRPTIAINAGNRNFILPMHGPLPSPHPRVTRRASAPLCFFGPRNSLLMYPALAVLALFTILGFVIDEYPEPNALLWALGVLCITSIVRSRHLPAIVATAFCLFIARLMFYYSSSSIIVQVLEVTVLTLLALVAVKVLKNLLAKRPAAESVSPVALYWALGLQAFLTIVLWIAKSDKPDLVLLILGIGVTLLVSLVISRVWTYIAVGVVTIDLVLLLNGLNSLSLLVIAVLLIAGVIWRLLTRHDDYPAQAEAPITSQTQQNFNIPSTPGNPSHVESHDI